MWYNDKLLQANILPKRRHMRIDRKRSEMRMRRGLLHRPVLPHPDRTLRPRPLALQEQRHMLRRHRNNATRLHMSLPVHRPNLLDLPDRVSNRLV